MSPSNPTRSARLYEEALNTIKALRRDIDFFQRYEYIAELPSTFEHSSEEAVLAAVCRFLRGLDSENSAWVYGVDHEKRVIQLVEASGPLGKPTQEFLTIGAATTIGGCVQFAQPRLIADCATENGYPREAWEPATGSVICLPIVADARCAGAVLYHAPSPQNFTVRDLGQLRSLATVAGVTMSAIRARKHAEWLATHDELTTLLNRRGFEEEAKKVHAGHGEVRAIFFMDIDKFKEINSKHLHAGGDQVLREAALRLRNSIGGAGTVCRWGGDELVAVARLPLAAWREKAESVVEDFRRFPTGGAAVTVTIGGAIWAADEDLLSAADRADTAMMRAKKAGRRDRAEFAT